MAIIGIVVMAYVQASMALKNRPASVESSTDAGEAAHMDGADFAKVMRRSKTMEINVPDQHQKVVRREIDHVETLGVDPKGSFKMMRPSLAEHTAGAAATALPGAADIDPAAAIERPGVTDAELQKAAAAQDEVSLEQAAAASITNQQTAEVASFSTRVGSMFQLINYPGFLGKRLPRLPWIVLDVFMFAVMSIALAGLWQANHPVSELSEWQKEHQFLVHHFQAKSGEPIKQKEDLATAVGIKSKSDEAKSEEAKQQPSFVDSLKAKLRLQAD